jgi:hypothetical protein
MTTELVQFDYQQLASKDAKFLADCTAKIKLIVKRTAADILKVGEQLMAAKERLEHGRYTAWIEAEFGWSEQHCRRFVHVARRFKTNILFGLTFSPTALYTLAAPSTPEAAVDEAVTRAESGETIVHAVAVKIIASHKAAKGPKKKNRRRSIDRNLNSHSVEACIA